MRRHRRGRHRANVRTVGVLLALCLLLASPYGACAAGGKAPPKGIAFTDDLSAAMARSKKEGRPVIAYFTFDACYWCKRLEKACFFDPKVVELSGKFIWVKVNRDRTPDIPKKLNVSAYPSLLTLGDKSENVFRFQSYQQPGEFISNLNKALGRYALYKAGKEWASPPTRPAKIADQGTVRTFKAPSEDVPGGITVLDESLWIAQKQLFEVDPRTGKVRRRFPLKTSVGDLCTDGASIYAVSYGWTAGKPIYVIDPAAGIVTREIVTEANKKNRAYGAKGVAWRKGRLYVLDGMRGRIHELDHRTGIVTSVLQTEGRWLAGLDFDGRHFVTGSREHLFQFDPATGKTVRKTPVNYPLRNVAAAEGRLYLLEQPIFGFGKRHERIRVWPQTTVVHLLTLPKKVKR